MFEVTYVFPDGTASEITSDWKGSIEENRPYLVKGDRIRVDDESGKRIYYERIAS